MFFFAPGGAGGGGFTPLLALGLAVLAAFLLVTGVRLLATWALRRVRGQRRGRG